MTRRSGTPSSANEYHRTRTARALSPILKNKNRTKKNHFSSTQGKDVGDCSEGAAEGESERVSNLEEADVGIARRR